MGKQKLVLIGNGMAGVRCVEEILALAPDRFEITIFGKEPHPNYNRIMLSKVLQGDTAISDITINDWQWYQDNGITLYTGDPVTRIDTVKRRVLSEKGRSVEYDQLIIATGSLPFMLPLPGADKQGVTAFRDINDCNRMLEASKLYKRAVVIGGGLLGLEAARGLLNLGMEVHVVHIFNYLMNRQLTPTSAGMLRKELEMQGMRFHMGKQTEKIIGKKRAEGLQFKDGSKLEADLVVIAVGVRPNIKLAADSGIETNRAIVVNDFMETNVPGVFAVGECAEHRNMVYGLVAPLYEQGKVLAKKICAIETEGYEGSILYSQLKVSGVEVFSAGEIRDSEITASHKVIDGVRNTYKKIAIRDNKIVGAVLFGDSSEGNKLLGYIKQQADVSELDKPAVSGGVDEAYAASISLTATVCSCNGVTKGAIMDAVRDNGCESVEDVRACTRASGTCGGCKPLVSAMLQLALQSKDSASVQKETVCGCTAFSHDELRQAVRRTRYRTAYEVMKDLRWSKENGCDVCRSALRYYVGLALEGSEDTRAKLEEESPAAISLHADNMVTIAPRMYGGVTSSEQLRQIADVIDQYGIPLVKLSNGTHIELLGIEASQADSARASLGQPAALSISYGKTVASVATCTGIGYDGSAMQDSVRLGILLERSLEHLQLPCQVSIAVSASPLHRAGTLAKDLGIAGAPGGWEIYVGGSGGTKLRQGELLCMEPSEETVLELSAAFLQWYREEAHYGETTARWVERIGITQLREGLFNLVIRSELIARFNLVTTASEPNHIITQPVAALIR
ncbi:nitrite reductase large subunit NirB [Paenibacillus montanisoli]|uniref:NAD(P)/FAD-dependent oxidoreductase n=1 Tax=Paenibacillus montanisoli TaxID=2081970 RepID=A0A328UAJ3_9BACL|nr:nitrite reductase large subunit NirB [Paenibacillus montanisoli]RAP77294.1 NAD(P)/FAD-dependent oxidoreductase [Paenibacillus montanisoli]